MGAIGNAVNSVVGGVFGGLQSHNEAHLPNIQDPINQDQLNQANTQTQTGLTGQQTLAQALAAQGGLQNQQNVFGQQQQLANALQMQAQGQGPSPALMQLNQATGQNVSNQAALMAGQRGSNSNVGLIARQAAQQGAGIQQQAAGQAAILQAQQQLAAQQQLQAQQAGMQQVAGQQVANQIGGQGAYTTAALQNQNQLLGGQGQFNNAMAGAQANVNSVNADTANKNAAAYGNILGGALGGVGAGLTMGLMKPAAGLGSLGAATQYGGGAGLAGAGEGAASSGFMTAYQGGMIDPHHAAMAQVYHQGGKVDALVSPGELYVPPSKVGKVAAGKEGLQSAAKKVPGKANVKGDSLKNDTVPAKLEEGGIVIPRSVLDSDEPMKAAKDFLVKALEKHGGKKEHSDFKGALQRAIASRGK